MNHQQSTSISGKDRPENRRGEGWGEGARGLSRKLNPSPPSLYQWEREPTKSVARLVATRQLHPSLPPPHSGLLEDFGPAHGFRLDEAVKLLGRAFADRNELKADKLLFDLGLGDGRVHRAVELGDDLRRRAARRCDRLPGRPVEARNADVGERRDV